MKSISLKLDKNMLKNIDSSLKENNYSTRTEFIRTAIRDKLDELRREWAIRELSKFRGSVKTKTSEKEYEQYREKALKELIKERGWD